MDVFKEYDIRVTPYLFIVFVLIWSLFILTIGSMYYECECRLIQCQKYTGYNDSLIDWNDKHTHYNESFNQTIIIYKNGTINDDIGNN